MKAWLWLIVFLVLLPVVLADWNTQFTCETDENCTVSVFTVNKDDADTLLNATNCTLTVFNTSDTSQKLLNGVLMSHPATGLYSYVVNFGVVGHYPSYVICTGSNVHIMGGGNPASEGDSKDVSFEVVQGDDWMLAVLLPILAVIGVFAYFSIRVQQLHYFIKVLLFLGSLSLTIVATNIGRIIVEENSPTSTGLITLLNTASFVLIILLIVITAYLIIYYIAELLWGIANTKIGKTP